MNRYARFFLYTLPLLLLVEYAWLAGAFDLLSQLETSKIIWGNLALIAFILANIFFFSFIIPKITNR